MKYIHYCYVTEVEVALSLLLCGAFGIRKILQFMFCYCVYFVRGSILGLF